jgi:uncharacterized membrane protein YkoI
MNWQIALCTAFVLATLQPLCAQQNGKSDKLASQAKISRAAAEKIALTKESGTIKEGELEKEHNKVIYSFDIQTSSGVHEVNVDAVTGKVVEDSVETAADEAKEQSKESPK